MRSIALLIALLVAFASIMPHPAVAHAHAGASAHQMGQHHSPPPKDCTDCGGGCIGCAAPVQLAVASETSAAPKGPPRLRFQPLTLTAFVTPFELPPPRLKA